ncbi:DUF493 domain-containing protein [Rhodocaloribacter litoris]|uniref:DUF493 domain-containing protein n=1 Tax=Rhodocaloribacter litoris TaxID=2558931 RepID=UPI0014219000|nr:DUF493 domain-containing protein [Rhodocaloribacter litoris]QXD16838.1 DUF493 domain-containing protein [Rhodocaloribacter litoris]
MHRRPKRKLSLLQSEPAQGEAWWDRFRTLLDEDNDWPSEYLFKFIVPKARLEDVKAVFGDHPVEVRASTRGNYMSVTARMTVSSSDEVVAIYAAAGKVEGIISL